MPLKTSSSQELPTVNLTPMIDIVFLLIVFFMVGTQFTDRERQIDIQLPGVGQLNAMIDSPDRREVLVGGDGRVYLDDEQVSPAQLTQRLRDIRRQYPGLEVSVRADGNARQMDVVPVYGAIHSAGVTNMAVLGIENQQRVR